MQYNSNTANSNTANTANSNTANSNTANSNTANTANSNTATSKLNQVIAHSISFAQAATTDIVKISFRLCE